MLTIDYRPRAFAEIVGQREPVSVMRAVSAVPDSAPRVYLFQGGRGLGKTTLARAFARSLTCLARVNGDACLACDNCKQFSDMSAVYQEYDATQVGNVQFMRGLHDHLLYASSNGWRVVVLDECQSATHQAQSALLKLLEEGPRDTFFIACTTDPDKILQTIRSRSVELSFVPVADAEVRALLQRIAASEKLELTSQVLDAIVSFSFGYVREAVMRLDLFLQIRNPEQFLEMMYIPEKDIIEMFLAIKKRDKSTYEACINKLAAYPLAYLKKSFEVFILNAIKRYVGVGDTSFASAYDELVKQYDQALFLILASMAKDWATNCFKSDLMFSAFAWYLYAVFSKEEKHVETTAGSRFNK